MKEYPSIAYQIDRGFDIYAFDKIDGSNVRCEWTRKNGFNKFGSRRRLMDESDEFLGEAIPLIKGMGDQLAAVFLKERWQQVTCFFEFHGPNSFAGQHQQEPHAVALLDVNPYKMGILPPRDFLKLFEHLAIPKLLYMGKANQTFEQSVRDSALPGMTFEGVVCKGVRKDRHLTMFKIKSAAWLEKLRTFCAGDEKKFQQLL
jgi:hypothetical protein